MNEKYRVTNCREKSIMILSAPRCVEIQINPNKSHTFNSVAEYNSYQKSVAAQLSRNSKTDQWCKLEVLKVDGQPEDKSEEQAKQKSEAEAKAKADAEAKAKADAEAKRKQAAAAEATKNKPTPAQPAQPEASKK